MTSPRGTDVPLVRRSSSSNRDHNSIVKRHPVSAKNFFGLIVGSLALGVACIAASLVGLFIWAQADYFHDPGPYAQNSWCGYDKRTFFGLLAFTACSTVGFTLCYVALEAYMRAQTNALTILAYVFFAFFSLNVGAVGMVWGKETMKCFGVFCVNMGDYVEIPNARPEAGIGFLAVVGIAAFASLVPISLVMIVLSTRRLLFSRSSCDPIAHMNVEVDPKSNSVKYTIAGGIFFVLVGLFAVTTFYIPNSWEYFVAARIAKNAALIITTNATTCNTYYNQYTCSELPWAYMSTANWQVSDNLILKLYPSNLLFFVYMLLVIGVAVVVRSNRRGRLFVKKYALLTEYVSLTMGECALALFTLLMVILFFIYWIHDHNYNGYWQGGSNPSITDAERWARSTGQVAVVFLSLLFFPASRNSVVHKIFGTSWEASIWAHKALGYAMLAATFSHMVAWYKFYDIEGFFPRDIFDVPMMLPTSIDNFTVPLSTLAAFILFICMGVFALEPIRRRMFELFYYTHLAAAYFTIPVILWHAAAGWEYMLPGIAVWFMDRIIRMQRSGSPVQLVGVKTYRDVTELRFLQPSMSASAGQYIFINIPEIALFEWHPFTLSTGAHSEEFTLHIKSMGPGTWTQRLHEYAVSGDRDLSLAVDGPYGSPFVAGDYKKVILVAGGIGITPCASIFSFLKGHEDISTTLLWSLREEEVAAAFAQHLTTGKLRQSESAVNGSGLTPVPLANARLFLTRPSGGEGTASILTELSGVDVFRSRPRFSEEMSAAAVGFQPDDVIVFVCGPEAMVKDAMQFAVAEGFHFHRETFLL